ncbi:hypothetical protein AVEN_90892-1 [Araneus ventricosus]|uniref:Uncharacterized protein n=1 Tax=Araneus ventricosus TaxID=182803 RepID=A0A4Y2SR03_ARAVE|nr:hypothetical protein AVEN_90892-1 [Araneus ventricosus]
MTTSASTVAEASSAVGVRALTMPENRRMSTIAQQKFLMCAEKEITMTVWKIIPMRRSFSFSIIGVIFTYAMIFYSLSAVCCDLRHIIQNFALNLSGESDYDYNTLLHTYSTIKSIANRIDDELGPLVFMITLYNTLGISSSLYLMLHPKLFDVVLVELNMYCLFFASFCIFLTMTTSASAVAEVSSAVGVRALTMSENRRMPTIAQQKFLMCAEKEITMTVWKIIPMRRSFHSVL